MSDASRPRLVPELAVRDLAASLRFWMALGGFRLAYERPEEGFAMLERDGARVMLEQPERAERVWMTGALEPPYGRGVNFEIDVDDLEDLIGRFAAADVPFFLAPETKWYRHDDVEVGVRQFIVQDPDGYLLRFSQRFGERPRRAGA